MGSRGKGGRQKKIGKKGKNIKLNGRREGKEDRTKNEGREKGMRRKNNMK